MSMPKAARLALGTMFCSGKISLSAGDNSSGLYHHRLVESISHDFRFTQNTESHDWLSICILDWDCLYLGSRRRASNYLFGPLTRLSIWSWPWMRLTEEVLTTIFFVMQPIGLLAAVQHQWPRKTEKSHLEARKLSVLDWLKYLVLTAIVWMVWALAYQVSITRPFSDSVTDATNGVGHLDDTSLPRAMDFLDCNQSL